MSAARRTAAAAATAASVIALMAGCGGNEPGEEGASSPTDQPSSGPISVIPAPDPLLGPPISDPAELTAVMLSLEQLPDGFSTIPDPVRDLGLDPAPEYDSPDRSSTDPSQCAAVLAPVSEQFDGAAASASARFSGPDFSSIDEDAASYPDRGAADAFTTVQNSLSGCTEFSGTDADGIEVDYTVSAREQTQVGDASTSVRLSTSSGGFTLVSDVVLAVVDSTVVQVVVTDQQGPDPATVSAVAELAVDRIRSANGDI